MPDVKRVLLTGATGFVGRHLYPALTNAGFAVVGASRDPAPARKRYPGRCFVRMDVTDFESSVAAMQGCDAAVYLVHSMADQRHYDAVERRSASNFARAAELAGLSRVVYLGGIKPAGRASRHLRSRLRTGELLRSGKVSTIELQAGIIVGPGSESWLIVRDLAARLPVMVLPKWLDSRTQPIAVEDVITAIAHALTIEVTGNPAYGLPGPEVITARDIILRTADLLGRHPQVVRVPVLTRRLSSYWISLVTRANPRIARQLVDGLGGDLLADEPGFWRLMPEHVRTSFEEAARRALQAEADGLSLSSRLTECLLQRVTWSEKRTTEATL